MDSGNDPRPSGPSRRGRTLITKEDLVRQIAELLGVPAPPMSTGSTEPRSISDIWADTLGIPVEAHLTKPEVAQRIVESTGATWNADYESRGGTVTKRGLTAVRDAVGFLPCCRLVTCSSGSHESGEPAGHAARTVTTAACADHGSDAIVERAGRFKGPNEP